MADAELRVVVSEAGGGGAGPSTPTAEAPATFPEPLPAVQPQPADGVPIAGGGPDAGGGGDTVVDESITVFEQAAQLFKENTGIFGAAATRFQSGVFNFLALIEVLKLLNDRGGGGDDSTSPVAVGAAAGAGRTAAAGAASSGEGFALSAVGAGAFAEGAVSSLAPSAAAAVPVALPLAVTALIVGEVYAIKKVIESLNQFGKELESQSDELAAYSIDLAAARQQLDVDRLLRDIDRAQVLGPDLAQNLGLQNQIERQFEALQLRFADEALGLRNAIKELELAVLTTLNKGFDGLADIQGFLKDNPIWLQLFPPLQELVRWIDFDRAERAGARLPLDLFEAFFNAPDPQVKGFNDVPGEQERRPRGRVQLPATLPEELVP